MEIVYIIRDGMKYVHLLLAPQFAVARCWVCAHVRLVVLARFRHCVCACRFASAQPHPHHHHHTDTATAARAPANPPFPCTRIVRGARSFVRALRNGPMTGDRVLICTSAVQWPHHHGR